MKKVIFTALIVLGYSTLTLAQEAAAATRRPQVDEAKSNKTEAAKTPVTSVQQSRAGMTDQQIADLNKSVESIDDQRKELSANKQLTPAEKEKAFQALEVERAAVLKKSLGADGYKKYEAERRAEQKAKPQKTN